nr:MAG TPA: hypothetical protein [Caudoviricetes sp.]
MSQFQKAGWCVLYAKKHLEMFLLENIQRNLLLQH